jgi:hypothetical protein
MEANLGSDKMFLMAKNLNEEAFNSGKNLETMKCLTLAKI